MELKRILAILAIAGLLLLYIATFILSIMNHPDSGRLLMASIVCTVFIPVIIHLLLMMNNARRGKNVFDEPYSYREKDSENKADKQEGDN